MWACAPVWPLVGGKREPTRCGMLLPASAAGRFQPPVHYSTPPALCLVPMIGYRCSAMLSHCRRQLRLPCSPACRRVPRKRSEPWRPCCGCSRYGPKGGRGLTRLVALYAFMRSRISLWFAVHVLRRRRMLYVVTNVAYVSAMPPPTLALPARPVAVDAVS